MYKDNMDGLSVKKLFRTSCLPGANPPKNSRVHPKMSRLEQFVTVGDT